MLVLGAFALIAYGLHRLRRIRAISKWPSVKATVVRSILENLTSSNEDAPHLRPRLMYEYAFQGKTFSSSVLGVSDSAFDFHSEREAGTFMGSVSRGASVDILVDLAAPSAAFIAPGASRMRLNHYATAVASGVLILIAGAGAWWVMHA
ncbi:hypothetical protein B0B52_00835 [Polaromonas sp. A23]|nr:hypothetical protein B0B52_00835 [Polaromonas sp. A23]